MAMKITDACVSCGACESACPNSAISQGDPSYVIDATKCDECKGGQNACVDACTSDAIVKA